MRSSSTSTPSSSINPSSTNNNTTNANPFLSPAGATSTSIIPSQDPNNNNTQQPMQQDEFLTDDFYPLEQANKAIISALRSEELSSNGDLYKRIAASSSTSSNYTILDNNATAGGSAGASSTVGGNASNFGNGTVNGTSNGTFHKHNGMTGTNANGTTSHTPQVKNINIHSTYKYTNSIPLPSYITNIIQTETKMSSLMGILPQGNMVWVSVDDALYLWEYGSLERKSGMGSNINGRNAPGGGGEGREDFVCFKVPSGQCVVSVGLVKPKKGEFLFWVVFRFVNS